MDARERLVDSAGELLWERGYVGTSPRAIQQRAGAGQGSMYHHFAGKRALALDAIDALAEGRRRDAEAALAGPGRALERVVAYLRMERDALRGCPVGRLTQDPDVVADADLRAPLDRFLSGTTERVAALLVQARRDGDLPADLDAAAVAATVVATVQGGYVLARAGGDPSAQALAVEGLVTLLRKDA